MVLSSGTFSANPLTMVAGLVAMRHYPASEVARLNALGERVRREGDAVLVAAGLPLQMGGDGSLFRISLTTTPVTDYRSSMRNAAPVRQVTTLHRHLLDEGVIIARMGTGCLSPPMSGAEVDEFVAAFRRTVARLER